MDQEATVPHTVPCGKGIAAFERVMRELGLEVPTKHAYIYEDSDGYSDGDADEAESVPVPVRSSLRWPCSRTCRIRS